MPPNHQLSWTHLWRAEKAFGLLICTTIDTQIKFLGQLLFCLHQSTIQLYMEYCYHDFWYFQLLFEDAMFDMLDTV